MSIFVIAHISIAAIHMKLRPDISFNSLKLHRQINLNISSHKNYVQWSGKKQEKSVEHTNWNLVVTTVDS